MKTHLCLNRFEPTFSAQCFDEPRHFLLFKLGGGKFSPTKIQKDKSNLNFARFIINLKTHLLARQIDDSVRLFGDSARQFSFKFGDSMICPANLLNLDETDIFNLIKPNKIESEPLRAEILFLQPQN